MHKDFCNNLVRYRLARDVTARFSIKSKVTVYTIEFVLFFSIFLKDGSIETILIKHRHVNDAEFNFL